jgi:hypothetical protein
MQDKIIQITDTINDDGEGQTLGLSESGKMYEYKFDTKKHEQNVGTKFYKCWFEVINRRWELLLESPELLSPHTKEL